jgi:hypothetical protein
MTTLNTLLYASQNNGGKATVSVNDIVSLAADNASAATTTVAGVVLKAADQAALMSVGPGTPAGTIVDVGSSFSQPILNANFATLATEINAILTNLKAAGIMA